MPGHRTKGFCASAAALALCMVLAGCSGSGESVGGGKVKQKLATQAAGGDAPDVMQLDHRQIDQYASGGVLLDLAKQKAVLRTEEIDAGLLATGRLDGTQYAIPQGRGTETVAYDVKAWKATGVPLPGKSWIWTEWADTMRALAERTGRPGATDPGQSVPVGGRHGQLRT